MLARIKKGELNIMGKNPIYKVLLECPDKKELYIHFDFSLSKNTFFPLQVIYDGIHKDAKLAWYTREVEKMTVAKFLETLADKINKSYYN